MRIIPHKMFYLSGTSKKRRKEESTGKNAKRPQHELDHHGLVPLPVKVCYTCNRYHGHALKLITHTHLQCSVSSRIVFSAVDSALHVLYLYFVYIWGQRVALLFSI